MTPGPDPTDGVVATARGDELLALHRMMARIRCFEDRVARHFRVGDVHGFVHVSIGQEAVAAGACAALAPDDYITTTHRGHGHCLAKGADARAMMAELFGRQSGLCHGRGGSMHLADASLGILGANGIVGAGVPIAAGAAFAAQVRDSGQIAVAFFGEGALHTGAFHEAASLAVGWQLPLLLLCEANGWAEFTPTDAWGGPTPAQRGAGYGMPAVVVDGSDPLVVRDEVARAAATARTGGGPVFIEATTVRARGHYEGDAQPYREDPHWADRDPLALSRQALADRSGDAVAAEAAAEDEMEAAVRAALGADYPDPAGLLDHVHG